MMRMKCNSKFLVLILIIGTLVISLNVSPTGAQDNPNTITFDNRSGEPALVILTGPSEKTIEVPNGQSRAVNVADGKYSLLIRYGRKPDQYSYSEGDPFSVTQTPTQYSVITITLHKVLRGNYRIQPTSRKKFETALAQSEQVAAAAPLQDSPKPLEPLPPKGQSIEGSAKTGATWPPWEKCLQHHPAFSRLPAIDRELGPILTLPERVEQTNKALLERMRGFDMTKPFSQQMTQQEREQSEMILKGYMLMQNCEKWVTLVDLSGIVMRLAGALQQSWQTYLDQQDIRNKMHRFNDPQKLYQQLKILFQKMEQFELTRDYYQQMSIDDRQLLEDIKHETPLVLEFLRKKKK